MLLGEIRDMMISQSKDAKEKACKKRPADIRPVIDVFRGGEPVATIMITQQSRENIVMAYQMAVAGFDADQGAYQMESFSAGPNLTENRDPITGEELHQTSLSELFYNHDGQAKGWATEALFIQCANRAGDILVATMPYHYVGGRYLVWDEPWLSPENYDGEERMTGAMADPIDRVMTVLPSFSQIFPGLAVEDVPRAELDMAVVKTIQRRVPCHVLLWAHHGGERERVLREAMRQR